MQKVITGLAGTDKFFAKLGHTWAVTTGHDRPRYVDVRTLRSGYLGLLPFFEVGDTPTGGLEVDATTTLIEDTWYAIAVVAVDTRQASASGTYRQSYPTELSTPIQATAGNSILYTIPVHPQLGYADPEAAGDYETTRRDIYVAIGSTSDACATATPFFFASVDDNTTTTFLLSKHVTATLSLNYAVSVPPNAKLVCAAFNRLWMAGGILENRGTIVAAAPVAPETRWTLTGNVSGVDQTYFREGHEGASITPTDGQAYIVDEVDATNQIIYLAEDVEYEGTLAVATEFVLRSDYGLYWSDFDEPFTWRNDSYIGLRGFPTALAAMGRSILVWTTSAVYRFSCEAPEQGAFLISDTVGTNAPRSVVVVRDTAYFWTGSGWAVTDGIAVKDVVVDRLLDTILEIDIDESYRITGGWDPRTSTIQWYYPVPEEEGCHYGFIYNPSSGDVYPVRRHDIAVMWQEGFRLYYGTTGQYTADKTSTIWAVDEEYETDGIEEGEASDGVITSIVGQSVFATMSGTDPIPVALKGVPILFHTAAGEDHVMVCSDSIEGDFIVTEADEPIALEDSGGAMADETAVVTGRNIELYFSNHYDLTTLTAGDELHIGGIVFDWGPKWTDFDSPRYLHRVYDLKMDFLPLDGAVTMVVDWYGNLNATPIASETKALSVGDTTVEIRFKQQPVFSIGFRVRVYGRHRIKIQHYTLTWATIR